MVLFFEYGRLGNQLFQYQGLRYFFPEHRIVFWGGRELSETIVTENTRFIGRRRMAKYWARLFAGFAAIRLISSAWEDTGSNAFRMHRRAGLLRNCIYVRRTNFQHRAMEAAAGNTLAIVPRWNTAAEAWLSARIPEQARCRPLVFIHVRRGDYFAWPSAEHPAVLDEKWYELAVEEIKKKEAHAFFIVLTDDPEYANKAYGSRADFIISDNAPAVDLVLMSRCRHGILSASSFAWWGSYLSRSGQQYTSNCTYLAPLYWAGHRLKRWHPCDFDFSWITYLEVE